MNGCERVESGGSQRLRDPDEGESDDCGRVVRIDGLHECGSKALAAESAGTVEWPVDLDVTRDFGCSKRAEADDGEIDMPVDRMRLPAQEYSGCMKFDGLPAAGAQLVAAAGGVARLVVNAPGADSDLVRSENPGFRITRRDDGRLGPCQSPGPLVRRFAHDDGFVDPGRLGREFDPKACQEGGPVGGPRRKNEALFHGQSVLKKQGFAPCLL